MKVTIKQLLEAGVHFGHQTRRWNPKMEPYIFGERNGIHIINLEKSISYLQAALEFVKAIVQEGKEILFVGTKRQAQMALEEAAQRCEMPFVNVRWLGGMLTNFETVRKSVQRLDTIDRMRETGDYQFYTKKEISHLMKEKGKLERNLMGVRKMKSLPGAIFVIDTNKEEIAIREAVKLGIPTIALLDTNCDPDVIDHAIPSNDDAIRSIKLMADLVADAVQEGREIRNKLKPAEEKEKSDEEKEKSEEATSPEAETAKESSPEKESALKPSEEKTQEAS